jgi:hypothetical protein
LFNKENNIFGRRNQGRKEGAAAFS